MKNVAAVNATVDNVVFGKTTADNTVDTVKTTDSITAAFFEGYRKANRNRRRSAEELHEMRAAFGTGTTVVDIITGERVRL